MLEGGVLGLREPGNHLVGVAAVVVCLLGAGNIIGPAADERLLQIGGQGFEDGVRFDRVNRGELVGIDLRAHRVLLLVELENVDRFGDAGHRGELAWRNVGKLFERFPGQYGLGDLLFPADRVLRDGGLQTAFIARPGNGNLLSGISLRGHPAEGAHILQNLVRLVELPSIDIPLHGGELPAVFLLGLGHVSLVRPLGHVLRSFAQGETLDELASVVADSGVEALVVLPVGFRDDGRVHFWRCPGGFGLHLLLGGLQVEQELVLGLGAGHLSEALGGAHDVDGGAGDVGADRLERLALRGGGSRVDHVGLVALGDGALGHAADLVTAKLGVGESHGLTDLRGVGDVC